MRVEVWTLIGALVGLAAGVHGRADAERQRRRGVLFADVAFTGTVWCPVSAVVVGALVVFVSSRGSGDWVVLTHCMLAYAGARLSSVDIDTHTIPRRASATVAVVSVPLVLLACIQDPSLSAVGAGSGVIASWIVMKTVEIASRGDMGPADVWFAALLGLFVGAGGAGRVFVALLAAFLAGGAFSLVALVFRRAGMRSHLPFGPFLFIGALAAALR